MRYVRQISPGCWERLRSRRWRCMPSRPHGGIRTPRRFPLMGDTQTSQRPQRLHGPPRGTATMAVTIANRGCEVSGLAGMAASPGVWACGMATGVIVWRRLWLCRSVSREGSRGSKGSWPIVRATVVVPEGDAWSRGSVW
jgi:hypothetical protein